MSQYRYLLVDVSGDVTGTNDESELPDVDEDDTVCTIIDTFNGSYTNENIDDCMIQPVDTDEDDDADDDGE